MAEGPVPRDSAEGKRLYNVAERDAYRSWVALHGPVKGGQKGFRAILRESGMKVPHHYRKTPATPKQAEAERKFVEEGLGRQGRYTKHRYPEAADGEAPDGG
jgi:hypothetical protein